jgi:hypothetical protein
MDCPWGMAEEWRLTTISCHSEHRMALATLKDIEVRKTNHSAQRPESLTLYTKDWHPKTKTLKDLLRKDIDLRDVVPSEMKTPKITLPFS